MSELTKLTYDQLREGYLSGKFLPSDVVKAYLQRMEACEELNAYITPLPEHAMAQANDADIRVKKGDMRPLEGFPLAVKDLFCTQNILTTAASHILHNFTPFYESTITERLSHAGTILLGKTNMDEFAMGSSTENSAYGPCESPWRNKATPTKPLSPGGSSGGSSCAVAARMALGALGSDTGGSIRQPASFTGLVGLKPTYGRCSRYGMIAFASSFDQAGPLTRTVKDTVHLFEHMSGYDPRDSTTAMLPRFSLKESLEKPLIKLKVGIPKEYKISAHHPEVMDAWHDTIKWIRSEGATIEEVSLPHSEYSLPTYYIIAPAEASSNLQRYDGIRYGLRVGDKNIDEIYEKTRSEGFGDEVQRRIVVGTFVLSSGAYEDYYLRGLQVRRLIRNEYKKVLKEVDVLLTPTTPTPPFALGEKISNPMEMYLSDILTVGANLAGLPAISVPVGLSKQGLPIGMQFTGFDFQEELLFRIAHQLEQFTQFPSRVLSEVI